MAKHFNVNPAFHICKYSTFPSLVAENPPTPADARGARLGRRVPAGFRKDGICPSFRGMSLCCRELLCCFGRSSSSSSSRSSWYTLYIPSYYSLLTVSERTLIGQFFPMILGLSAFEGHGLLHLLLRLLLWQAARRQQQRFFGSRESNVVSSSFGRVLDDALAAFSALLWLLRHSLAWCFPVRGRQPLIPDDRRNCAVARIECVAAWLPHHSPARLASCRL